MAFVRACSRSIQSMRVIASRQFADAAPAAAAPGSMSLTFGSPASSFYKESIDVQQVDIPTGTGYIGVLANHVPSLGVMKPGILTVLEKSGTANKYFVSSGSFSINADASVSISAEEAVPLDHLDKAAAQSNLTKAQQNLSSAKTEIEKAEAQVEVECLEAIVAAI